MNISFPDPNRRADAKKVRDLATDLSTAIDHPKHIENTDPKAPYVFKFTKGLSHDLNGLLTRPADYEDFADGTRAHDPDVFARVQPFRGDFETANSSEFDEQDDAFRQWESPTAGHAYVLEGPDPFALTMPPAPTAASSEFAAEMAEVYQMALSRDWPIAAFMDPSLVNGLTKPNGDDLSNACKGRLTRTNSDAVDAAARLAGLNWFKGHGNNADTTNPEERNRRRFGKALQGDGLTASNMFRGAGEDGWATPFLSQFMVMGGGEGGRACGQIQYGAQSIDQRVRVAEPGKDYMTTWDSYLDVQNGLDARKLAEIRKDPEFVPGARRFMSRLRDMATYVHDDQLYQAYFNAALLMLGEKYAADPGLPFHKHSLNGLSKSNREPFALFGGPHLLTLLTEVSSRGLKAVRLQKFSVHRRMRPEVGAAAFHTVFSGYHPQRNVGKDLPDDVKKEKRGQPYATGDGSIEAQARSQLGGSVARFNFPNAPGNEPSLYSILEDIRFHNAAANSDSPDDLNQANWLLPMAFPEGSPMHPAYGAGHATVAGACVTLLKAFFNMSNPTDPSQPAMLVPENGTALVPDGGVDECDVTIDLLGVSIDKGLTLEGELNKLMWNISNARNIAGVHYYTDYIESALLGEAITLGILREQMLAYHTDENVSMTVPLLVPRTLPACLRNGLDGAAGVIGEDEMVSAVKIRKDGTLVPAAATPGRT